MANYTVTLAVSIDAHPKNDRLDVVTTKVKDAAGREWSHSKDVAKEPSDAAVTDAVGEAVCLLNARSVRLFDQKKPVQAEAPKAPAGPPAATGVAKDDGKKSDPPPAAPKPVKA